MKLIDYEHLSVQRIRFLVNAPTPPAGTRIKRSISHYPADRLFYNFNAIVTQTHPGGSVMLGDGDVVLIPRNVAYNDEITKAGHALILYIDLSPEIPDGIYQWHFSGNPDMKQRFLNIENLWNPKKPGYYVQCMSETYEILSMIMRKEKSAYTCSAQNAAISAAVCFMHDHFSDPDLSIPMLAEQCKLSYSHFRKLFFDVHGVTASAYLKQLRLDYACQLLTIGDYTVAQTARMSGFSDVYYFSSFFKRHMGISPTEYQRRKH